MAIHKTEYKTENGKTRKVKQGGKPSSGAAGASPGADGGKHGAGNPGK